MMLRRAGQRHSLLDTAFDFTATRNAIPATTTAAIEAKSLSRSMIMAY